MNRRAKRIIGLKGKSPASFEAMHKSAKLGAFKQMTNLKPVYGKRISRNFGSGKHRTAKDLASVVGVMIDKYDFERSGVMSSLRESFPNVSIFSAELDPDTLLATTNKARPSFNGQVRLRLSVPYKMSTGGTVDASIVKPVNVQGHLDASGSPRIDRMELAS